MLNIFKYLPHLPSWTDLFKLLDMISLNIYFYSLFLHCIIPEKNISNACMYV